MPARDHPIVTDIHPSSACFCVRLVLTAVLTTNLPAGYSSGRVRELMISAPARSVRLVVWDQPSSACPASPMMETLLWSDRTWTGDHSRRPGVAEVPGRAAPLSMLARLVVDVVPVSSGRIRYIRRSPTRLERAASDASPSSSLTPSATASLAFSEVASTVARRTSGCSGHRWKDTR